MTDEPENPEVELSEEPQQPLKFDSFAKEALRVALEQVGDVEPQKEIATHPQFADFWFEPNPQRPLRVHPLLRLLVRMGDRPALFEPFSEAPTTEKVLDVLGKSLSLNRQLRNRAKRQKAMGYQRARVWVIAAGRPNKALAELEARPDIDEWPEGFYRTAEALWLHVVVVRELPRTPETLLLRLMGRGRVLKGAMEELRRYVSDEVAELIIDALKRWQVVRSEQQEVDVSYQEVVEYSRKLLAEHEERIRQEASQEARLKLLQELLDEQSIEQAEGAELTSREAVERSRKLLAEHEERIRQEASQEARLGVLKSLCERRLGRPLLDDEVVGLRARLAETGDVGAMDAALERSAEQLAAWLVQGE